VLISIDGATEVLQYTPGTAFPILLPPADREAMIPAPPDGSVPLAAICLYNGMTAIGWDYIYDIRLMIGTNGALGAGAASRHGPFVVATADAMLDQARVLADGVDTYAVDAGAGTTIAVNRAGNKILLFDSGGAALTQFDANAAGLIAALAAAGTDDVIWLPPTRITIAAGITIPDAVHVIGSEESHRWAGYTEIETVGDVGAAMITYGGDYCSIEGIRITYLANAAAARTAVLMSGQYSGLRRCTVSCSNNMAGGTAYAIRAIGNPAQIEHCQALAYGSNGADAVGIMLAAGLESYALDCTAVAALQAGMGGTFSAIEISDGHAWNCWGIGDTYGLRMSGAGTGYARFGFYSGVTADLRVEAGATLEVYCVQYNVTSIVGTLAYLPGDRVSPVGALHDLLSATHTDTVANPPLQGAMVVGNGTPAWVRLNAGGMRQFLEMDGAGQQPQWTSFDWDLAAAAVAADMVHDHSAAAEGGQLDWDNVWSDAVHTHESAAEGGEDIRPDSLGVNTPVPDQDGAIAQAEVAADPSSGGAGTARIYPKDDGGQSKYFFMDDAGSIYEIAGIAEDLTVTVGVAGDFATIQAAIDWFKNWIIKGACIIDCDEAAYDEAVDFSGMLIAPGATLTLQGDDTHLLGGMSYVDGAAANQVGIANGGSGTVSLSIDGDRDTITVTMSTTNPEFDADNWAANDRILVFADNGVVYLRTLSAVLNNTLTLTVALPAGATVGNDGTAICLLPDRSIDRTAAGPCITVNGTRGIVIAGWYLEPTTGAACYGVYCSNGAIATLSKLAVYTEDYGVYATTGYSSITIAGGVASAWGTGAAGSYGFFANSNTQIICSYTAAVNCNRGYLATGQSLVYAYCGIAAACTTGFHCSTMSILYAYLAYCRVGTTGYYAEYAGYIMAASTVARNTAATPYNPTPTNTFGNNNGHISFN